MKTKEIIILIVIFVSIFLLSTLSTYLLLNIDQSSEKQTEDVLNLENYTLKYGRYIGYESEHENDKVEKKKVMITLTKKKINGTSYEVKGNKIYVNGFEMYEVPADNKMVLLAGEGVEYNYEG